MIFLDFDGVLFDTLREAYAVSLISSGKYNSIEEVDFNCVHYQNFKSLRYLIAPAWNYKYLLEELKTNEHLSVIACNLNKKLQTATPSDYAHFEGVFFQTRDSLKKNHYEQWVRLNAPFPFLSDIKFLFQNYKNLVYIVTTKDRETVIKLLSRENIEIDQNRIFDRDDYKKFGSKKDIIFSLQKRNVQSIFIDDSSHHLKECANLDQLKCLQPDWGYIGLEDKAVSRQIILREINNLIG